jgi:hypothetical protein
MKLHTLAYCFLVLACAPMPTRAAPKVARRAKCELRIQNQVSGSIKNGVFEIILTNQSNYPLWANVRMAAADPDVPPGLAELSLDITGPFGKVTFTCLIKSVNATEKDYVVLKPGQHGARESSLLCFEGLDAPGTYTVQAHFQDRNPSPPPAPPGTQRLSEELVSAPVQFQVLPKR